MAVTTQLAGRSPLPVEVAECLGEWRSEAAGDERVHKQLGRHYMVYARRICAVVPHDDAVLTARDRALRTTRQLCQQRLLAPDDDPTAKQLAVERALSSLEKACRAACLHADSSMSVARMSVANPQRYAHQGPAAA